MVVPAQLIRYTWFVGMTLSTHFWLSEAAVIISLHPYHHKELMPSMTRRSLLQGNSNLMLQQELSEIPDEQLEARGASSWKKKNVLCRTLRRRCLQMPDDNIAPTPTAEDTVDPAVDPPVADLPTLPTDPESGAQHAMSPPPPPPPRTNPSSLLAPPLSGGNAGPGVMSVPGKAGLGSNMASKVGITAGVGVTGVAFVIVGLLYYFKSDIFLCCKTCVRVQIFHHNASHN